MQRFLLPLRCIPFTLVFVVLPVFSSQASVHQAENDYRNGAFQRASEHYREAAKAHPEDGRLHYNLGTSLYREGQYEAAAEAFEQSLYGQELELQENAFYNLGVTKYQLGKGLLESDPQEALKAWESGLKDFQSVLDLAPGNEDAQYNYDFLKSKIKALKEQQQKGQKDQNAQDTQNAEDSRDSENAQNTQDSQTAQRGQSSKNQERSQPSEQRDGQEHPSEKAHDGRKQGEEKASAGQPSSGSPQPEEVGGKEQNPMGESEGSDAAQDTAQKEDQGLVNSQADPSARSSEKKREGDQQAGSNPTGASSDTTGMSREEARQLLESVSVYEKKLPFYRPNRQASGKRTSGETSKNW